MDNENLRSTLLFVACALTILFAYQAFVLAPLKAARERHEGKPPPAAAPAPSARAPAPSPRVRIDTPSLAGSIALRGARLDDLSLKRYRATADPGSPTVQLLRPEGPQAWFAEAGWAGADVRGLPDSDTVWMAPAGAVLTPRTPVELTYADGRGLVFHRTIAVDPDYMFTITDRVSNGTGAPVDLRSYAVVRQEGLAADVGGGASLEGAAGVFDGRLRTLAYKAWKKAPMVPLTSTGGWLGLTEKYWLTALVPDQAGSISGEFRAVTAAGGVDTYQAGFSGPVRRIAPGQSLSAVTRVFAGAKSAPLLRRYSKTMAIPRFDDAVDWGWLWFLTKPIFLVLQGLEGLVGNVGAAILLLTLCIRLPMFPLAYRGFAFATKMKAVQPRIEDLRRKFGTEPARLQQELAALHAREQLNPLANYLLLLVPLPIFLALYKVLSVTIELRHAPFFGWITDLSARDPSTLWTLFGLLPWSPAHAPLIGALLGGALHLGAWPLLYGVTTWLTQAMNPTPGADPLQQRILVGMALVFTFAFAQLAAGLVIYYVWSNLLTIAQQYVNMRLFKVDNPIDRLLSRLRP